PFEHEEGGVAVALEAERPNDIRMRQQADVLELALESAELLRAARNVRRQDQGGDMRAAVLPAQPVTRPVDRPEAPLLELLLEHEPIAQHGRDTARPGLRLLGQCGTFAKHAQSSVFSPQRPDGSGASSRAPLARTGATCVPPAPSEAPAVDRAGSSGRRPRIVRILCRAGGARRLPGLVLLLPAPRTRFDDVGHLVRSAE